MANQTRYRAIRKIAEGGSAEVYLAQQLGAAGFQRTVVLKRIRAEFSADPDYRDTLLEEARLAMSLHHSNLVELLDMGDSGGHSFLVLELVDGWTLHHLLQRARDTRLPLPASLAVYIAAEVCRALAYAHERTEGGEPLNIVHRDVCPRNVLLSTHAEVKLIDFGIARSAKRLARTGIGRTKGKPAWMSPEQARGEPLDGRSDLFSVGSLLFAMLADAQPFTAENDLEVLTLVSKGRSPSLGAVRPDLPAPLVALVFKAMAAVPNERFGSAQELLLALEQVQRSALPPAGRSELENFLRLLSARDGDTAITRQALPPAMSLPPLGEVSLAKEETSAPVRRRRAPWAAALTLTALAVLSAVGLVARARSQPASAVALVPMPARVVVSAPPPPPRREETTIETSGTRFERENPLQISARLAPKQRSRAKVSVLFESNPAGAVIKVDDRELGRTPATAQLKNGKAYEVQFEAQGRAAVRKRLMLTPKAGRAPKVTLQSAPTPSVPRLRATSLAPLQKSE